MNVLHVKWMLYNWKGVFSWLELHVSHERWVITQNMHHSPFSGGHLVPTFTHTCKLQIIGCILVFYIPNDSSTTGDIIFDFRTACEFWLVSYISKYASSVAFSYIFTCNLQNIHSLHSLQSSLPEAHKKWMKLGKTFSVEKLLHVGMELNKSTETRLT